MNVPTTSLSDTGVAGITLGFATRFQNNVRRLSDILDPIYFPTCSSSLRRHCS